MSHGQVLERGDVCEHKVRYNLFHIDYVTTLSEINVSHIHPSWKRSGRDAYDLFQDGFHS
jgi:hypothetical protein